MTSGSCWIKNCQTPLLSKEIKTIRPFLEKRKIEIRNLTNWESSDSLNQPTSEQRPHDAVVVDSLNPSLQE